MRHLRLLLRRRPLCSTMCAIERLGEGAGDLISRKYEMVLVYEASKGSPEPEFDRLPVDYILVSTSV